jgi:hypothetical protein
MMRRSHLVNNAQLVSTARFRQKNWTNKYFNCALEFKNYAAYIGRFISSSVLWFSGTGFYGFVEQTSMVFWLIFCHVSEFTSRGIDQSRSENYISVTSSQPPPTQNG